jgi:hypothetical protein
MRHERITALLLLVGAMACSGPGRPGAGRETRTTMTRKSIDQVLAAHNDSLMAMPGVVGTAIGLCDGERCIKVFTADAATGGKGTIPSSLEGYRVVVEVTGPIRPR